MSKVVKNITKYFIDDTKSKDIQRTRSFVRRKQRSARDHHRFQPNSDQIFNNLKHAKSKFFMPIGSLLLIVNLTKTHDVA